MKLKRFTMFFMVLTLILGISPVLSVSARVGHQSATFDAYPDSPRFTVDVTCDAWLNNRKMDSSFSYSYPQGSQYEHPENYTYNTVMVLEAYNYTTGRARLERFIKQNYATITLGFDPDYTQYSYYFDNVFREVLYI